MARTASSINPIAYSVASSTHYSCCWVSGPAHSLQAPPLLTSPFPFDQSSPIPYNLVTQTRDSKLLITEHPGVGTKKSLGLLTIRGKRPLKDFLGLQFYEKTQKLLSGRNPKAASLSSHAELSRKIHYLGSRDHRTDRPKALMRLIRASHFGDPSPAAPDVWVVP